MNSLQAMLASDQDRERVVRVLREAYAAGRLDLAELRERAGAAYRARTWGDLRLVTADIPVWVIAVPGESRPAAPIPIVAGRQARVAAPVLLLVLAGAAGVAAAWVSTALVPLMIMSACVLLAAACSARPPGGPGLERRP